MKKILKVFKSTLSSKTSSSSTTQAPAASQPSTATTPATQSTPATAKKTEEMASAPQDQVKVPTSEFIKAIGYRRTVYPLTDKISVSDDRIEEIVKEVLAVSPSSYNTQPMRVAIMLGDQHKKLWQIIREQGLPLLQGAGEEIVAMMKQRFDMFEAAYGSITFWDDQETIKQSQETHKAAAGMFPQWAEHANGMLQIQVWTAVELEGLGANLQHMNMFPPAEAALKKHFGLPESWSWKANLNIGGETAPHPTNPEKKPFSETIKVFK